MRRVGLIIFFLSSVFCLLSPVPCPLTYADIKLKVAVVNPSETEEQTTPVRYDLPKGMTPDVITDVGSMELKYDFDKGSYYLYEVVKLKPSEKVVLEIKLRDIWSIPQKDIDFLEMHTKAMSAQLVKTRHAKTGDILARKILDRLYDISKKEADANRTISEHINIYYENLGIMGEIKEDIGMLENLVLDVGGIVEDRVEVPATLAVPIRRGDKSQVAPIELTVNAFNPSGTTKQYTDVKYILPQEVAPRYVIDRGGLEMGYDFARQSFYVYKDKVELAPSETKSYIIKIMDIWWIPAVELDALKGHTNNLMLLLKGTEYFDQAKPMADKITHSLDEVRDTQALKVPPDEHIAYYRKNLTLIDEAQEAIGQLEKLTNQSGASAGVTIKEAEIRKGGGAQAKRARGYEGIDYIVKSIFKGRAPTPATTWKIIYLILIFLGVLTIAFFGLWYTQVSNARKQEDAVKPVEKEGPGDRVQGSEKKEEEKK
ncbi:MAG: hypothetical protein Q7S07_02710 [Candidatus Omnitrophota bacterium]|nr:hypothetical protein [Candidatus Omnitrophota bacterium]